MVTDSHTCAKHLSVSGVGLNTHPPPTAMFANNMHVQDRHKSPPRLLENLIIVCIVEDEKSRLLLFIPLKYRQVNFHRHGVGLNVLDNAMKLSVVNVNVRNLHARRLD
jgi:hypothetical protein